MKRYFQFDQHGATYRRETLAGITTFLTMAYIIVVNPAIMENAGIAREASLTATILASAIGTLIMALWARRPFAVAPLMGENAFVAFVVVKVMGYSWQVALGAVFIAGAVFACLTILGIRSWLAEAIPMSLKIGFAAGIGLFLTFIGLNETGLVVAGELGGPPVKLGDLGEPSCQIAMAGFMLTAILVSRRVRGSLIIGTLAATLVSIVLGITPLPSGFVSLPPSLAPVLLKLDIAGAFTFECFPVVMVIFIMAFLDTVGTLIGLSMRANLLDEHGNLPGIERPMMADALATMIAPLLGTSTSGAYIESAAGIEEGGRTGFSALVVALLFLLSLFFAPLLTIVPPHAYGIVLVVIGAFMIAPVARIDFSDMTELIPAFLTITLMAFTYNIGIGMTAGMITYAPLKLFTGRVSEVKPGMWILALLAVALFIFMPR